MNLHRALRDIGSGLSLVHLWPALGWHEVRQRYRRSVIGPFWLTLTSGMMVAAMGPLYGHLLKQDSSAYITYIAAGLIVWQFLAALASDACQVFIAAEGYIKEVKLPLTVYAMRSIWKNLIIFFHNFVVIVATLVYSGARPSLAMLLFPIGLLIVTVNALWLHLLLGLLSARFRDVPLIVSSVVQVLMFLTPVWWRPEMLGTRRWAADWNPMYHLVEIVRAPLLGVIPGPETWIAVLLITVVGFLVTLPMFAAYRGRVPYWV